MSTPYHRARAKELYGKSIPQLFLEKAASFSGEIAYRHKKNGIYREVTWGSYRKRVEAFCLGLIDLGMAPGDRVAFMGDTYPEYFIGDLAVLCGGGVTYGIYATCSEIETEYQVAHAEASFFVAENQEYVDKIIHRKAHCPTLKYIIVADMSSMFGYSDSKIISFAQIEERGLEIAKSSSEVFLDRASAVRADALAVLVYTSGTTGAPKAAMHSHRDVIVGQSHPYLEGFPELDRGKHRLVTHLPLAHLVERSIPLYLPLIADLVVHFGEDVESLPTTLYEVTPTFFHAVPRIWEKMACRFLVGIERSTPLKRLIFEAAMKVGKLYIQRLWKGERIHFPLRLSYALARLLVFRPMLMKAGLSSLQGGLTAGAPISGRIQELWHIWGVNLRNIYGITEGTVISCQTGDFPRPGDAGAIVYPKEVRLAADGEVLVRGNGIFLGYWKDEAASAAAHEDGWFKTGDIARWTESSGEKVLTLVDRKKDLMITKGGKNIAPSEIESLLKTSHYISEAILFADDRKYPTALIEIDFDTVAEWARKNSVLYNGYSCLATSKEVERLIAGEVDLANSQLARVEQVKKFQILPKELDPEEGGTTPTRKIKRKQIYEMFRDRVEMMYEDKEQERLLGEAT